jgi:hypothetical protein
MLITKARRFFKGLSSIRSAVFMAAILIASPLLANDVNLTFTTPTNKDQVHPAIVHVKIGDTDIPVQIPAGTTAPQKRDLIRYAINSNKIPSFIARDNGDTGISIKYLTAGTAVTFTPGDTGESQDKEVADATTDAWFGFGTAEYASTDASGNPSQFTGGIVTDLGELSFTVSADQLHSLDGTTITQALFADLAPLAPSLGASILNEGDELMFTFNPLDTQGGGGVIVGTTALTPGAFEGLVVAPAPEPAYLFILGSGVLGLSGFLRKRMIT